MRARRCASLLPRTFCPGFFILSALKRKEHALVLLTLYLFIINLQAVEWNSIIRKELVRRQGADEGLRSSTRPVRLSDLKDVSGRQKLRRRPSLPEIRDGLERLRARTSDDTTNKPKV